MVCTLILVLLAARCARADDDEWTLVQNRLREGTLTGGDVALVRRRLEMVSDERGAVMSLLGSYVARRKSTDANNLLKDPLMLRLRDEEAFYWLLDLAESEHARCAREKSLATPNCADFRQHVPTLVIEIITMAKAFLLAGHTLEDATPEGAILATMVDARDQDIMALIHRAVKFAPDAAAEAKAEQTEGLALFLLAQSADDVEYKEEDGEIKFTRKHAFTEDDEAAWELLSARLLGEKELSVLSEEDVDLVYKRLREVVDDRGAVLTALMGHIAKQMGHDLKGIFNDAFVRSLAVPASFEGLLGMALHEHETCVRKQRTATPNCESFREHVSNLVVLIVQQAKSWVMRGRSAHEDPGLKAMEKMVDAHRKKIKALVDRAVEFARDTRDTDRVSSSKESLTKNAGLVDILLFRTRDSKVEYVKGEGGAVTHGGYTYKVTPRKKRKRKKKKGPRQDL